MADPWYVSLFKNYAHHYDNESFTRGTLGECDFIEQELGYDKSLTILDVGCGTGRHTIELAKRGYTVTGIDLSEAQLKRAKEKAEREKLNIPFLQADARNLDFEGRFDAAIMLCEGGFCLMETDKENEAILVSIARSLKDDALLILTALNGLFALTHPLAEFYGNIEDAGSTCAQNHFDAIRMRDGNTTTFIDDEQVEHTIHSTERFYIPSEIQTMLGRLGFSSVEFFGATLGSFSRDKRLSSDDFEMLVVANRKLSCDVLINHYTDCIQSGLPQRGYRLIISLFNELQAELQLRFPQAKITAIHQGYPDMSYAALAFKAFEPLGLKLAVVYLHRKNSFEFWLAARSRSLQDTWREKLRAKVQEPYQLVEKGRGVDAIVSTVFDHPVSFENQITLTAQLCDTLQAMFSYVEELLQ
ncbi:class I SAM-dependent methyltransferase [uncultured Sphaerochaeta sp.]|jgi:SAM-dependent methyltransferase|uniref:class I SAM-dependent methyltransferase n=1 Tax=uncultured Sphaerochaeta sp. TaxID=886478 RepID=UPI00260F5EAA|nr:class I SAM-dependent methyltransferase [uncultured Sphaerochaeta sp.]